jgi:hypothetical protein
MGTSASMAGGILTISGGILTALTGTATFTSVLRIRDVYPGSDFFPSLIPYPNFFHPGSRIHIKEFEYFNPKNSFLSSRKYDPGCSSRNPDFLPIPDFRSRGQKAPDPGSATLIFSIYIHKVRPEIRD